MLNFIVTGKRVDSNNITSLYHHGIPARIVVQKTRIIDEDYNPRNPNNCIVSLPDNDVPTFIEDVTQNGWFANEVNEDDIDFITHME